MELLSVAGGTPPLGGTFGIPAADHGFWTDAEAHTGDGNHSPQPHIKNIVQGSFQYDWIQKNLESRESLLQSKQRMVGALSRAWANPVSTLSVS